MAWRRFGAGNVLYLGVDELWRWRYNVGDRYHQKFWVQMTNWVSEKPFSVQGKNASLAADKMVYDPGETAQLRVRIRDDDGKPVNSGNFAAVLYRDGNEFAELELEPDPNRGGIFRGRSGELRSGEYEVAIRKKYFLGNDQSYPARGQFFVRPTGTSELDRLAMNRDLLQNVARQSGGQFFMEEEARYLVDMLESIDKKRVISSDTILWSSYFWFAPIIALLTAEWLLRKRAGFV